MKKITLLLSCFSLCMAVNAQSLKNSITNSTRNWISETNTAQRNPSMHIINAATTLFLDSMEGDNSVAGLTGRGYTTYFRGTGGPGLSPEWYQGDITAFTAFNGTDTSYVASDYNSVTGINNIDNWLVLPSLNVASGDIISFYARSPIGSTFPDTIRVMFNATGATLPEDISWVELGRFKAVTSGGWGNYTYTAPAASATGVFAIRHAVVDAGPGGNNCNYVGIDQIEVYTPTVIPGLSYDTCANALGIDTMFGGTLNVEMISGPYDNSSATTDATDPLTGWACFGEPNGSASAPELNKTVWFTFIGDGGYYFMESGTCAGVANYIDGGDTQFALYSGNCGSFTPVKCSEDGPNSTNTDFPAGFAFTTQIGVSYYLMVDGFSFLGTVADGEFCLKVTRLPIITCADPSITAGTTTQNKTDFCLIDVDSFIVDVTGAIAPNVGDYAGISIVVSTAPLTSADPNTDPAAIVYFNFANPAPPVFTRSLPNNNVFITTPGTYYFTPVLFGNATAVVTPAKFLNHLALDTTCITFGTPAIYIVHAQTDPFCTVGMSEFLNGKNEGISVYPSPAPENLNIDFISSSENNATLSISDYTGRILISKTIATITGTNKTLMDVSPLTSGLYIVTLTDEKGLRTIRFVKD